MVGASLGVPPANDPVGRSGGPEFVVATDAVPGPNSDPASDLTLGPGSSVGSTTENGAGRFISGEAPDPCTTSGRSDLGDVVPVGSGEVLGVRVVGKTAASLRTATATVTEPAAITTPAVTIAAHDAGEEFGATARRRDR